MDTVITGDRGTTTDAAGSRLRTARRIFVGALIFNTCADGVLAFCRADPRHRRILRALRHRPRHPRAHRRRHLVLLCHLGIHLVRDQDSSAEVLRRLLEGRAPAGVLVTDARTVRGRVVHVALLGAAHPDRRHDRPARPVHHACGRGILLPVSRASLPNRRPALPRSFCRTTWFDAVITSWVFLAFYYVNGFLAAAFYGPQSRVMDGVLARANCLLITTLWTAFKFVMVPIGGRLAAVFPSNRFAAVFALIWGAYIVTDAMAEVGGALFGKQTLKRSRHRRRQPEVHRRHVDRLRERTHLLPLDRRQRMACPAAWIASGDRHRGGQHSHRTVLAAGHRRLLHGHRQRVDLSRFRSAAAVLSAVPPVPGHWASLALVTPSRPLLSSGVTSRLGLQRRNPLHAEPSDATNLSKNWVRVAWARCIARATRCSSVSLPSRSSPPSIDQNDELRERFFREARAAGQLSHKNIITIHDLGEHEGQPYLAMEYLHGQDLLARMASPQRMSLRRRVEIATEISEGLEFAHSHGIVHRDIKPANIFITDAGAVKILDFGLARLVTSELTRSNMMMGTVNYMAPEQMRGETHRSPSRYLFDGGRHLRAA